MPVTDLHPSGSILAVNNTIKCVLLPSNTRTVTTYTLTLSASAPAVGATSLTGVTISPAPTASQPLYLEDGVKLTFTGGKEVIVFNNNPASTMQTITSGTATINIVATTAGNNPTASTTATTKGLLELLGIQQMDYNKNTSLISIRSQKSGLGNEQRPTMISAEFQISGWIHQRDNCYRNVIKICGDTGRELYAEVELSDGRLISGVFGVANMNTPIQLDQVLQISANLYCQGLPTEVYT